jgi:hypothetical protein
VSGNFLRKYDGYSYIESSSKYMTCYMGLLVSEVRAGRYKVAEVQYAEDNAPLFGLKTLRTRKFLKPFYRSMR